MYTKIKVIAYRYMGLPGFERGILSILNLLDRHRDVIYGASRDQKIAASFA